jgi:ferredoxin
MINLANGDKCTGCCACMNSCEVDALQIKTDEFGFFRPAIDQNKCIRCL